MMEFRTMRPSEFDDWTALCAGGFDMPPDEFHDHYVTDPNADPEGIFVAVDDGRMVSSVRVFDRRVYIRRTEVKCGCIGEVCTLPEYRGRGLNKRLLELAVGYMLDHGMPISQLFTGSNDYYAKMGWFTVPMRFGAMTLAAKKSDGMTLDDVTSEDVPKLEKLHRSYADKFDGVIVREGMGEKYWLDWMKRNPGRRAVVRKRGRRVAYIDYESRGDMMVLREYLGDNESIIAVFCHAMAECGATKVVDIPSSLVDRAGLSCAWTSERRDCMYRLISPFAVNRQKVATDGDLMRLLCEATTFNGDNY